MHKAARTVKKIAVGIAGTIVVIIGIILTPLPGPGLLIIFAGLLILSSEFEWANKYAEKARSEVRKIYEKSKARADRIGADSDKDKSSKS